MIEFKTSKQFQPTNQTSQTMKPTACPVCSKIKTDFFVTGHKTLNCTDCVRDLETDFQAIFGEHTPAAVADPRPIPVNEIKNGEFIRFTGNAKKPTVYEKIGYDRSTRRYKLQCTDDISRLRFVKGSTRVFITDH